ncbi:YqhA family protein, partial [Marinobacter salsuginis]|uniref:YqhA family protein n=1 Tax=Marinobacter salsuginis TaxID=418719 RepID=UPI00188F8E2A
MKWLENTIEWLIFQSRWLLAPVYLGLVAALALLSFKFLQELVSYAPTIITSSSDDTILAVLSLVDLVLVGNLIILVIFAGYENFVSKIETSEHPDRPSW